MRSFQPQDISDDRPIEIVNIFCSETITIFGAVMLDGGNEVKSDGLWQRRCVLVSFVIIMRWFYHTRVLLLLCRRICLGSLFTSDTQRGWRHACTQACRSPADAFRREYLLCETLQRWHAFSCILNRV